MRRITDKTVVPHPNLRVVEAPVVPVEVPVEPVVEDEPVED